MIIRFVRLCLLAVIFIALPSILLSQEGKKSSKEGEKPGLMVGAATSVITPPLGEIIVGSFSPTPAEHVHDELHARCLVLDDGEKRIAFVVCDLLGLHRSVGLAARKMIEEELSIPAGNIMVSGTHTHSATNVLGPMPRTYASDIELSDYERFVARRIADGVHRAVNLLRPAEMAYGYVDVPEHVFNRRWFVKEGAVRMNPFGKTDEKVQMNPGGVGYENLIKPAGPTDPRVSILAFREPDGGPFISVFTAYSLHYVGGVGPSHVSADYYGYYCRAIEKALTEEGADPSVVALMANGTSGDVNNVDYSKPRPPSARYEKMQYVADDVAEKVLGQIKTLEWNSDVTVDARYRELDVQWRKIPEDLLQWAKETEAKIEKGEKVESRAPSYAARVQNLAKATGTPKFPAQVFRIGDVCVGGSPVETFAETGLEFREKNPFEKSFIVELANGYFGYMPTPRHFELGGYETWPATNAVEQQASVKMMNAFMEMAKELKK